MQFPSNAKRMCHKLVKDLQERLQKSEGAQIDRQRKYQPDTRWRGYVRDADPTPDPSTDG
jgi:hypothetical protein